MEKRAGSVLSWKRSRSLRVHLESKFWRVVVGTRSVASHGPAAVVSAASKFRPPLEKLGQMRSLMTQYSQRQRRDFQFRGSGTAAKQCCNRGVRMRLVTFSRPENNCSLCEDSPRDQRVSIT